MNRVNTELLEYPGHEKMLGELKQNTQIFKLNNIKNCNIQN